MKLFPGPLRIPAAVLDKVTDDDVFTQLKTIAGWRATPYLQYLINTPKPANHDREVCSIMPALTQYKENKGRLPLWDQELLGDNGKRLGVVRWGQGIPSNSLWSPSYRCDWKQLGVGNRGGSNTGGCIYIRADRVFTMSKSDDVEFLDVIEHIEKALNPATNAGTYPPYRPGDTTAGRDINLPPVKGPLGNELPKVISGNYAKPPNIPEDYPLWRGTDKGYEGNRAIFSKHPFSVPQDNFTLGRPGASNYGVNYCKYYTADVYVKHG